MRESFIKRETFETKIEVTLNIDGTGKSDINTGIGFFDHMLTHLSKHGFFDLTVKCEGDLYVDCHHTVEDIGIVLGKCFKEALSKTKDLNIKRFGNFIMPMEESLILCSLDISGRPFLVFDAEFTTSKIGELDTEMIEEFFRAFCNSLGLNLHFKMLAGKNNHHIAEAMFKAFAKALDEATIIDSRIKGVLSTKGVLEV